MQSVIVRDLDGVALAVAVLEDCQDGRRLVLGRVVTGKGRLLNHYFGKGLREVLLDSREFRLRGVLSTRWVDTERRWFVEMGGAQAASESTVDADGVQHRRPPSAGLGTPRRHASPSK